MSSRRVTSRRGTSKPTARKTSNATPKVPAWMLLLTGFATGFFVKSLIDLTPSAVDVPIAKVESGGQGSTPDEPDPVFDFYTLLPETEVVLPDLEATSVTRTPPLNASGSGAAVSVPAPGPQPAATSHARYLLQAGSFRSEKDAERLRANLILSGLSPRISKVSVNGGETWHRVQIGPFDDQGSLDNARSVLAGQKIDSLLLRLK